MRQKSRAVDLFQQNQINFLVNNEKGTFSEDFHKKHGPCVSSMGWLVMDAEFAFNEAVKRGAKPAGKKDYKFADGSEIPAIYGIGDSLIYFIDMENKKDLYAKMGFEKHPKANTVASKGFLTVDHLTNNVEKGTMSTWSDFYKKIFGFHEIKYFDIRGAKTGLLSYALKSPCGTFCIPINEGTEDKSQINEYLREYKGPGVQHIAFLTEDIIKSVSAMRGGPVQTLDIDREYYQEVFTRVPNVTEDHKKLEELDILIDGDDEGYLLQIFTKNIIGPIFIEIIQRKNHHAFGEGNFGALFRSIERDQERRGVL
jgi:4-hydroxyphenylpyruvate dioxygenase